MAFGFGFGMPRSFAVPPFSPASLFSGGAPGVWYDPSDYTTLFQDSAGTTPVTAVEQPVGLMLDKSKGLVLGPELVLNGDFSNGSANWTTGTGWSISGGSAQGVAVAGADLTSSFTTSSGKWYQFTFTVTGYIAGIVRPSAGQSETINVTANGTYTYRLLAASPTAVKFFAFSGFTGSIDNVTVKELPGNHAFQTTSASRPVLSARVNKLLATATLATQSVTTRATAHTLRFEGAGTVTLTGTAIGVYTAGTHSITTTAGTLTLTVVGSVTSADLRETNDGVGLPVYQAVVTSTNYATTGFLPFLRFDGVDDGMLTNSISFTSTDKISAFAGARKLSNTAYELLYETSIRPDLNNGAFGCFATDGTSGTYGFNLRGTSGVYYVPTGYTAPITSVLSCLNDIGGASLATELIPRINGALAQVGGGGTTAGTGNFGNYPLFIGRRNNATNPFNGQLYSMVIVGKQVTATELSSTETYTAIKTGVTLA